MIEINSTCIRAPDRFLSLAVLREGLSNPGADNGRVSLLMGRAEGGRGKIPDGAELNRKVRYVMAVSVGFAVIALVVAYFVMMPS